MKAMLFAAGLGTRLKPFTDTHPKALVEVNGKALLERNIEYLKSYGITEIVINIHHFGKQVIEFLQSHNFGCTIEISDERKELLETGGGLLKAAYLFNEDPFLVMNADILTDMNLLEFIKYHNQNKPLVSLAVSNRESSRKLYFNQEKQLSGWKNFTTGEQIFTQGNDENICNPLAFSGIHIIDPNVFKLISHEGKFSIMKVYMELMQSEKILGYQHSAHLVDVGKPEAIAEAEKYFK